MSAPNKYDLSFLRWFHSSGWRIVVGYTRIEVWTSDDSRCPFKVTQGMVERLHEARLIERIFPDHATIHEEVYQ